jgi:hypothetical protein
MPLVTGDAFFGVVTTLMGVLLVLALVVILVYTWDSQQSKRP